MFLLYPPPFEGFLRAYYQQYEQVGATTTDYPSGEHCSPGSTGVNYLAHFHLAGNDPAMISGALLGDFVKGPLHGGFHQSLEHGIRLHRRIDAFSDSDALLSAYRRQLTPDLHRYSSIITDVVFDYHLSRHWQQFHEQTLRHFADSVYAALADRQHDFPLTARRFSAHMIEQDLLLHYGQWPVIDRVLKSIAARLPHDNPLQQGSTVINTHQDLLQQAFFDFYPRVVTMAQSYRSGTQQPGYHVKIIACIEDPGVIERILAHLKGKEPTTELAMLPEGRAPPQARLFDGLHGTPIIGFAAPLREAVGLLLAGCRELGGTKLKTGAVGVS